MKQFRLTIKFSKVCFCKKFPQQFSVHATIILFNTRYLTCCQFSTDLSKNICMATSSEAYSQTSPQLTDVSFCGCSHQKCCSLLPLIQTKSSHIISSKKPHKFCQSQIHFIFLKKRRLSCKNLATKPAVLQVSCKIGGCLARFLQEFSKTLV